MRLIPLTAVGMACLPIASIAADYLSLEQMQKLSFPQAERFEERSVLLEPAVLARVQGAASAALASGKLTARYAMQGTTTLGMMVVDEVLGKFEQIRYAVALDAAGAILRVEILSYRESHGQQIRLPAWRKQFVGKNSQSALRVGADIANISGATLSCTHVTDGVRRLVTVLEAMRRSGSP